MNSKFMELNEEELNDINGGVIGVACAVVGALIAAGSACYGYGYAKGQQAGYKALKKKKK